MAAGQLRVKSDAERKHVRPPPRTPHPRRGARPRRKGFGAKYREQSVNPSDRHSPGVPRVSHLLMDTLSLYTAHIKNEAAAIFIEGSKLKIGLEHNLKK